MDQHTRIANADTLQKASAKVRRNFLPFLIVCYVAAYLVLLLGHDSRLERNGDAMPD